MRKIYLLLTFMAFCAVSYAQNTYEITTIGQVYSVEQIENAIESEDFCGTYYNDERHLLVFDDGTEVELKSNDELALEGINLSSECYTTDRKQFQVVWAIGANGTILKGSPKSGKVAGSN